MINPSATFEPNSHKGVARRLTVSWLLVLLTSVGTLFVLDRLAAWWLGAAVSPVQIANPPNLREIRDTIEFVNEFRTNSMGLRYRELPLTKQSDAEFRVIVVGDSFTEGYGVAESDRFSSRLENSLSSPERPTFFINCGLSGTGPVQYGRILFAVCTQYHPDLALIVVHANDPNDTPIGARLDLDRTRSGRFAPHPRGPLLWLPGNALNRMAYRMWPWTYARLQQWSMARDKKYFNSLEFLDSVHERARRSGISDAAFDAWKARLPKRLLQAMEQKRLTGSALAMWLLEPDYLVDSLDIRTAHAEAKWLSMESVLTETISLCREVHLPCAVVYAPASVQYDEAAVKATLAWGGASGRNG
jgi:hypothetical protein